MAVSSRRKHYVKARKTTRPFSGSCVKTSFMCRHTLRKIFHVYLRNVPVGIYSQFCSGFACSTRAPNAILITLKFNWNTFSSIASASTNPTVHRCTQKTTRNVDRKKYVWTLRLKQTQKKEQTKRKSGKK